MPDAAPRAAAQAAPFKVPCTRGMGLGVPHPPPFHCHHGGPILRLQGLRVPGCLVLQPVPPSPPLFLPLFTLRYGSDIIEFSHIVPDLTPIPGRDYEPEQKPKRKSVDID